MCVNCNFTNNYAYSSGGALSSVCGDHNCDIYFRNNSFSLNGAKYGGVLRTHKSNVTFDNCDFENNEVYRKGGVGFLSNSTIFIEQSSFIRNHVGFQIKFGEHAGVLYLENFTNVSIYNSKFCGNSAKDYGGCIYASQNSRVLSVGEVIFEYITARYGGVIYGM